MPEKESNSHKINSPVKHRIHEIIFEADTKEGKLFDVVLLVLIVGSVLAVILESVSWINKDYGKLLYILELIFTVFFTIEYLLRIYSVQRKRGYMLSFYGIIDLISILPTYISLFIPGTQAFLALRAMRLMRVFRIFKLANFLKETNILLTALKASRAKITVFLTFIVMMVIVLGSVMYLIEAGDSGFDNIPRSIYWAIVTLTTVGYGDIAPSTALGQFVAAIIMILGYAVLAVPTGIVSAEIIQGSTTPQSTQVCPSCSREGHDVDAIHCKYCGNTLN